VQVKSDLRSVWRAIWAAPVPTLSAILALALGIGATTTIFGMVNAVLIRPLPYPDADRLVEIAGTVQRQEIERRGASYPDYFDWRDRTRSFDGMASWSGTPRVVVGSGAPSQVETEVVDGPYFDLLGARPLLGRVFQASDHRIDGAPVAVIGETFWRQHYGGTPDVLGRTLQLDARAYTVVGVVPSRFRGRSDQAIIWTPAATTVPQQVLAARGSRGFGIVARLRTGVTIDAAQQDVHAVSAQLARDYPGTNEGRSADVVALADELFQDVRPAVQLLFGMTIAVLLIACANVASLLLARSEGRRREIAVRRALGSSNRRLVGLMLLESAMLVMMGVGGGWLIAGWTSDVLVALSPVQLPSFALPENDWRAVLFVAAIGVLMTLVLGLTPTTSGRRDSLSASLHQSATEARGGSHRSTLRVVLVGQVAVSVVLLVAAALLARSFVGLLNFDPGFDPPGVLSFRVQIPAAAVPVSALPQTGQDDVRPLALLEQIRAIPGVRLATLTSSMPLVNAGAIFYAADNMPAVDATNRPRAYVHLITPGYFETLGIRLLEGRGFVQTDIGQNTAVVVSENLAKRFWPGQSAIGRRIAPGGGTDAQWLTIVGVVEETNFRGIPRNPTADPDLFLPFNERARAFAVLLRTDGDPEVLMGAARAVVRRAEPGVAISAEQTLSALVDGELGQAKFLSWLTGAFAVLALTLAIIGIYGTFSYWVRRRHTEIGIRSALGATQAHLLRLVVGQAVSLGGVGAAAGLVLAAGLARYIETQLYAVKPLDWMSFAAALLVMVIAVVAASFAPAMRAAAIDPGRALRENA
jgi:predicted permease